MPDIVSNQYLDVDRRWKLTTFLLRDWVNMSIGYNRDEGMLMLGTYCTNFLICNLYAPHHQLRLDTANTSSFIHLYFVVTQLLDALQPGSAYPMSCPQCQDRHFSVGNIKIGARLQDYAPLLDRSGEPRNSVEEPTVVEGGSMA